MIARTWIFIVTFGLIMLKAGVGQPNKKGSSTALTFDGTDDYVQLPELGTAYNLFTVSAWFNLHDPGGQHDNIITYARTNGGSGDRKGWYIGFENNGKIRIRFGTSGNPGNWVGYDGTKDLSDSTWHHLCTVFDEANNDLRIYLDGKLIIQDNPTWSVEYPDIPATIGVDAERYWNAWFNGHIDEVRVWNRALSTAEVQQLMTQKLSGTESGLVGYWRLDENASTTANDSSPNGNDGTLQ